MAKGLQIGDKVTVNKVVPIEKNSPAYEAGLQAINPGQIGRVVEEGTGRSMIVDFDGNRLQISNQRLQLVNRGKLKKTGKRGRPKGTTATKKSVPSSAPAPVTRGAADMVNYDSPQFAATVANKLLISGSENPDPDTVVVEIRLSQLPTGVQNEIRQLLHKKLSLGLEDSQPRKRGRPPKAKSNNGK